MPLRQRNQEKSAATSVQKPQEAIVPGSSRFAAILNQDFSQATNALFEREVARGVSENEEIFAGEEDVSTISKPQWAGRYRPRKPRYFNRVQMGYEWNKYNQTHYDHDNPPPKVVQGYKFNIFYPDLIDKTKAPTYRIEREDGRKRGQSFAAAGEEDTCLIRFVSSPPYEDVAFRIVDKEWDYSAKRERGFKSSFDKVCCGPAPRCSCQQTTLVDYNPFTGNLTATLPVQKGNQPSSPAKVPFVYKSPNRSTTGNKSPLGSDNHKCQCRMKTCGQRHRVAFLVCSHVVCPAFCCICVNRGVLAAWWGFSRSG